MNTLIALSNSPFLLLAILPMAMLMLMAIQNIDVKTTEKLSNIESMQFVGLTPLHGKDVVLEQAKGKMHVVYAFGFLFSFIMIVLGTISAVTA